MNIEKSEHPSMQNAEIHSVGKMSVVVIKKKDFWLYITDYGLNKDQFLRLNNQEKEKIFLKWKWGSSSPDSNQDCESTRKYLIRDLDDNTLLRLNEGDKYYWSLILAFEKKCLELKREMGLIIQKTMPEKEIERINWND